MMCEKPRTNIIIYYIWWEVRAELQATASQLIPEREREKERERET
jgi:hypothetical protein